MTSCCGEHYCQSCITPFIQEKQPCPNCSAEEFTTLLNVKYQQKILQLEVHCAFKDRGCTWVGPLSTLDKHVDSIEGDCQFLETDCPNHCQQKVVKNNLEAHLAKECFERQYICPFCSHQDTYSRVSDNHMQECPYLPIRCPNFCGVTCEQDILSSHMLICPLEKGECEFAFSGCKEKFLREDQESHLVKHQKQHFSMLVKECSTMKRTLQEKDEEMRALKESFVNEQRTKQKNIESLQKHVQDLQFNLRDMESSLKVISASQATQNFFRFPFNFSLAEFTLQRKNHNQWSSDSIGTHPKGYKMQVIVHPNGVGEGAGTHVSLGLRPVMTIQDTNLKWPAKCSVTLQLMNQFHDQDHLTVSETLTWDMPASASSKILNLSRLFVKHEDLEWNARKRTRYLYEDTLQFRVMKINVLYNSTK